MQGSGSGIVVSDAALKRAEAAKQYIENQYKDRSKALHDRKARRAAGRPTTAQSPHSTAVAVAGTSCTSAVRGRAAAAAPASDTARAPPLLTARTSLYLRTRSNLRSSPKAESRRVRRGKREHSHRFSCRSHVLEEQLQRMALSEAEKESHRSRLAAQVRRPLAHQVPLSRTLTPLNRAGE